MPRPHEAVADAVRTARTIAAEEGAALAAASRAGDDAALEAAFRNLTSRIVQAILDAERDALEREAAAEASGTAMVWNWRLSPAIRP